MEFYGDKKMNIKNLSFTYRFLRIIGLNYSEEEYGQVSLFTVLARFFGTIYKQTMINMMHWSILSPINPRKVRPWILRKIGCHVGKDIFVGDNVRIDSSHASLIFIEDHVHIAGGTRLLCHQRDLSHYCIGDDYAKLGYRLASIHLKKGCLVGMESFIMPGVTVGEGAIVGAGSLVTKDIPAWKIATGRPAKVIKQIPKRGNK